MNVVGGNAFLRNLRNLEYFKMDLGTTKRSIKTGKFKKLSEFELKYANLFENPLLKYGTIGSATFYEDMEIKEPRYFIFNDEDVYEIHYSDEELEDFGNYILTSMRKVTEAEEEEATENEDGVVENTSIQDLKNQGITTWASDDIKNGKQEYLVDQTLSREEYRKQLIDKKKR